MDKVQRKKEIIPVSLENKRRGDDPYIIWTERGHEKIPFVRFHAKAAVTRDKAARKVGETYNLRFKLGRFASPLLRDILFAHGFQEALGNSKDYNLLWMGPKLNPAICKNLASFQKVNRFPNTRELGRKDSLCKNIRALRLITRSHRFDFMPKSYLLPKEYEGFRQAFQKRPGQLWIKKPVASSCGCGIKVIDSMKEVSKRETAVVSSYISNPLLINGYKFDLRLYVLVTSYSPLVIYLYQDGLTRFATEKYQPTGDSLRNKFMHLTNTSVNKKSSKYVNSDDQEVEDHGNLWSLSALLRYLKESGKDTAFLLRKIEDIIIKTIISAEKSHVAPPESYPPHKNNSFELYGFDILIDDTLKPWLLEVNESPALSYDNPMSFKIKTHLLADTLTLVGVEWLSNSGTPEDSELQLPQFPGHLLH
uniref:Tubulin--tyrosine ligase-like protein 5 n=1 Tax=Leptobrachium leishanense TaxID=445787 RepID=A0A8C5M3P0_9ANUR